MATTKKPAAPTIQPRSTKQELEVAVAEVRAWHQIGKPVPAEVLARLEAAAAAV